MNKTLTSFLVVATIFLVGDFGWADQRTVRYPDQITGMVIHADLRFDPAIQRYMAEQSLRALPLLDGRLYYIVPVAHSNAYLEGMQIQYLEGLLRRRQAEEAPATETIEPADE